MSPALPHRTRTRVRMRACTHLTLGSGLQSLSCKEREMCGYFFSWQRTQGF